MQIEFNAKLMGQNMFLSMKTMMQRGLMPFNSRASAEEEQEFIDYLAKNLQLAYDLALDENKIKDKMLETRRYPWMTSQKCLELAESYQNIKNDPSISLEDRGFYEEQFKLFNELSKDGRY